MLRTEKGITLVALIITIIVLVILAAVSIATVYQMGIMDYAINASNDYATARDAELTLLNEHEQTLSSIITKLNSLYPNS